MIPLEYIAFLNETGYGQAAFDLISALLETGKYDIRIACLNGSLSKNFLSKQAYDKLEPLMKKPPNQKAIQIYHCIPPMQMRRPRTDRAIGFATFETYEPPSQWITLLNRLDAVICPSDFNYKIFAHAGVKRPLFYIPHCVNTKIWNDKTVPLNVHDRFTFLFSGAWKKRKGWPELIEAYFREFDGKDKVQLLIKTDKSDLAQQEIQKIRVELGLKKDYPAIIFEKRVFNDEYLPSFYKSADCLIMPTLGEGFGLPAMQCMSVKVPVIVTNFSGCQDYASAERCTLLEPSGFMMHSGMDQISQFINKKWPRLTIQSIQEAMRKVFSNREEAKIKADKAYAYVQETFSYSAAAVKFDKLMESVYRVC